MLSLRTRRRVCALPAARGERSICRLDEAVVRAGRSINHKVGIHSRGLNVPVVHGPNCLQVLRDHGVHGPSSFHQISLQAADEAEVRIRIDVDFQAHERTDSRIPQGKEAFDNNDRSWLDHVDFAAAGMSREQVAGLFDALSTQQLLQVTEEQIVIDGVRLVIVNPSPFFDTQLVSVMVIGVQVQQRNAEASVSLA